MDSMIEWPHSELETLLVTRSSEQPAILDEENVSRDVGDGGHPHRERHQDARRKLTRGGDASLDEAASPALFALLRPAPAKHHPTSQPPETETSQVLGDWCVFEVVLQAAEVTHVAAQADSV